MTNYKLTIKKLFEAVDPEGQLKDVQKEMEDTIDAAIQAQAAEKDEQIKNLESTLELIKARQQQSKPVNQDETVEDEAKKQAEQLVADLDQQAQEAFDKIEQQEQEIEKLKQALEQSQEQLVNLQRAVGSDAQAEVIKQQQKKEDEKVAIAQTQELIDAMEDKAKEDRDNLVEAISDFIDAFIDDNSKLNVAINATALAEANKEVFSKIRDLLFDKELFESGVTAKAERIIAEAKKNSNLELNEAISLNKKNLELQQEVDSLKGQAYLAERVRYLKPSIAEGLMEAFKGKSIDEIDEEFEKIQQQLEKNEEERKALIRQRCKLRQQKIDRSFDDVEDIQKPLPKQSEEKKPELPSVQSVFAKLIKVKKV